MATTTPDAAYQAKRYKEHREKGYSWACAKGSHGGCGERAQETCTCSCHATYDPPRRAVELGEPGIFLYAKSESDLERLGWLVRDYDGHVVGLSAKVGDTKYVLTMRVSLGDDAPGCDLWNRDV